MTTFTTYALIGLLSFLAGGMSASAHGLHRVAIVIAIIAAVYFVWLGDYFPRPSVLRLGGQS